MSVVLIPNRDIEESHFENGTADEQDGIFVGQPVADPDNQGQMRPVIVGDENGELFDIVFNGTVGISTIAVDNWNFESLFTAGLADYWAKYGASQTYAQEQTIVHDGLSAQKVTVASDSETCGIESVSSPNTTSGSTYRVTAWVYCNEATTVKMQHAGLNSGTAESFSSVPATTWYQLVWTVDATSTTSTDVLRIYRDVADSDVSDYIIIDEVGFTRISKYRLICKELSYFGRNVINGATVEFTSGTNNGETSEVVDFYDTEGAVAFGAATTANVIEGDTFTLTIFAKALDFEIEITETGDVGQGGYHWSWDGGETYIGRTQQMSAEGFETEMTDAQTHASNGTGKVVEMQNGDLLFAFTDDTTGDFAVKQSGDQGLTWGATNTVDTDDEYFITDALVSTSGRILVFAWLGSGLGTDIFYSDDNGNNWASYHVDPDLKSVILLPNGNLLGFNDENNDIRCQLSTDNGYTWGAEVTVVSTTNNQTEPSACLAANGDIVCCYTTDEDSSGDLEVECKISSDYGATWGSQINVGDWASSYDRENPALVSYPDGTLYVVLSGSNGTIHTLVYKYSYDYGATWEDGPTNFTVITSNYDQKFDRITASVVYGTRIAIITHETGDALWLRFGFRTFEDFSNSYPIAIAINGQKQDLICGARVKWYGKNAVAGDKWTFKPDWQHAAKNIVSDSIDETWRSINHNTEINLSAGHETHQGYRINAVALFGCNFWDCNFQMSNVDSWATPLTDNDIVFTIDSTGDVTQVSNNHLRDATLLANYKDHELAGKILMPTSGTDNGVPYRIRDNIDVYIQLDHDTAHNIIVNDTFKIYQDKYAALFGSGFNLYRFFNIEIPAQRTPDEYYEIGAMVAGFAITLSKSWAIGYNKTLRSGIEYVEPTHGGMIPIDQRDDKYVFQVNWQGSEETVKQVHAMYKYLRGRNIALIPNDSDLSDVYLCKLFGDLELKQWFQSLFNFSLTFEEI